MFEQSKLFKRPAISTGSIRAVVLGALLAVVLMGAAPAVAQAKHTHVRHINEQVDVEDCTNCANGGTATGGNGGIAKHNSSINGGNGANGGDAGSLLSTNGGDAKADGGSLSQSIKQLKSAVGESLTSLIDKVKYNRRAHSMSFVQRALQTCTRCSAGGTATGGNGGTSTGGIANGGNGGAGAVGGTGGASGAGGQPGANGAGNVGGSGGKAASNALSDGGEASSRGGSVLQALDQVQQAVTKRIPRWVRHVSFKQFATQRCLHCSAGGTATGGTGGTATAGTANGGDGGTGGGGVAGGSGGSANALANTDGGDANASGGSVLQTINQSQQGLADQIPKWVRDVKYKQQASQVCVKCSTGGTATGGKGGAATGGIATGGDGGASGGATGSGAGGTANASSDADGGDANASGGNVSQTINQSQAPVAAQIPDKVKVSYQQEASQQCAQCSTGGTATGGQGGTSLGGIATGGNNSSALPGGQATGIANADATGGDANASGGNVSQTINQSQPPAPGKGDEAIQSATQGCVDCAINGTANNGFDGTAIDGIANNRAAVLANNAANLANQKATFAADKAALASQQNTAGPAYDTGVNNTVADPRATRWAQDPRANALLPYEQSADKSNAQNTGWPAHESRAAALSDAHGSGGDPGAGGNPNAGDPAAGANPDPGGKSKNHGQDAPPDKGDAGGVKPDATGSGNERPRERHRRRHYQGRCGDREPLARA